MLDGRTLLGECPPGLVDGKQSSRRSELAKKHVRRRRRESTPIKTGGTISLVIAVLGLIGLGVDVALPPAGTPLGLVGLAALLGGTVVAVIAHGRQIARARTVSASDVEADPELTRPHVVDVTVEVPRRQRFGVDADPEFAWASTDADGGPLILKADCRDLSHIRFNDRPLKQHAVVAPDDVFGTDWSDRPRFLLEWVDAVLDRHETAEELDTVSAMADRLAADGNDGTEAHRSVAAEAARLEEIVRQLTEAIDFYQREAPAAAIYDKRTRDDGA